MMNKFNRVFDSYYVLALFAIDFINHADFVITNSSISFFNLDLLRSKEEVKLNLDDNLVEILQINNIKLPDSSICIRNGFYKNLIIKDNLLDSVTVDFADTAIENLDLNESLYSFIKNEIKNEIILKKDDFLQNSKVFKILSKMFADNYQYRLQDLCFYFKTSVVVLCLFPKFPRDFFCHFTISLQIQCLTSLKLFSPSRQFLCADLLEK